MPGDLRALPKGHLHYHLEPCMRPATLARLCEKYGVDRAAHPGTQRHHAEPS